MTRRIRKSFNLSKSAKLKEEYNDYCEAVKQQSEKPVSFERWLDHD
jgi:lysine/ornithine N-monooxygenase